MPSKSSIKSSYKDKLVKLFASLSVVVFTTLAVINTFIVSGSGAGSYAIVFALKVAILPTIVLGLLGYLIGSVLDRKPHRHHQIRFITAASSSESPANKIESVFLHDEPSGNELQIGVENE